MKNNLKAFLGIVLITIILVLPFLVFAQETEDEINNIYSRVQEDSEDISTGNKALDKLTDLGSKSGYATDTSLPKAAGLIVRGALSLLGIVFVVLIIIGGYKWLTAGGDEKDVTTALSYIKRAVIGLIIIISAWAIWAFIIENLI